MCVAIASGIAYRSASASACVVVVTSACRVTCAVGSARARFNFGLVAYTVVAVCKARIRVLSAPVVSAHLVVNARIIVVTISVGITIIMICVDITMYMCYVNIYLNWPTEVKMTWVISPIIRR